MINPTATGTHGMDILTGDFDRTVANSRRARLMV